MDHDNNVFHPSVAALAQHGEDRRDA